VAKIGLEYLCGFEAIQEPSAHISGCIDSESLWVQPPTFVT
jgi:hypothetical protein